MAAAQEGQNLATVKRCYCPFLLGEDKGAEVHPVFLKQI